MVFYFLSTLWWLELRLGVFYLTHYTCGVNTSSSVHGLKGSPDITEKLQMSKHLQRLSSILQWAPSSKLSTGGWNSPKQLKIITALLQDSVVWRLFVNLLSFPRTFYIFMTPTWAQISWSLFLERFGKLKVDSLRIIQPLAGQDAATDNFARWWLVSNSSKAICKYYIISQFHILHHVVYHIMSNHIVSYPTSYYTSYHILSNHIVQHIVHYISLYRISYCKSYHIIKGSLDEKLPSYEVLKMLRE